MSASHPSPGTAGPEFCFCLAVLLKHALCFTPCVPPHGLVLLSSCCWLQAHIMPLAAQWDTKLTPVQKLCFLRCLRPDKLVAAMQGFVSDSLGARFIEPPPFDLAACFKESDPATPLVFVLSAGRESGHEVLVKISLDQAQHTELWFHLYG